MDNPQWLPRREWPAYLREHHGLPTTVSNLQKEATHGGGPRYCLWGNKAVSTAEWLDDYVKRKISPPRSSTANAASAEKAGA